MDDWQISGMAKGLAERLEEAGIPYETESFYFAGCATSQAGWEGEVEELAKTVAPTRLHICLPYIPCRYDPPFRLTGRHQEVWLVAKEEGPARVQA